MSDPISISGTAVGVISLGFTVCQGLISYYQSWSSCDHDVLECVRSLQDIANTLSLLKTRLPNASFAADAVDHIKTSVIHIEDTITKLDSILKECERNQAPANIKERAASFSRRAIYPFKKSTIQTLQDTVTGLQQNLGAAVQVLQLDLLSYTPTIYQGLGEIKQDTGSISGTITTVSQGVDSLARDVPTIKSEISEARQELSAITRSFEQKLDGLSTRFADLDEKFPELSSQISDVQSRLEDVALSIRHPHTKSAHHDESRQRVHLQVCADINRLQHQLVGKPDLLRNICDDVGLNNATLGKSHDKTLEKRCCCVKRRRQSSLYYWTQNLALSGSKTEIVFHEKYCCYSNPAQKNQTLQFRAYYASYSLWKAVEATMQLTIGAGGMSISPSLRIRSVIPYNSRVMALLGPQIQIYHRRNIPAYYKLVSREIFRLFREGKASPYDINPSGFTALHSALKFGLSWNEMQELRNSRALQDLVQDLVSANVPLNERPAYGESLLDMVISAFSKNFSGESSSQNMLDFINKLVRLGCEDCTAVGICSPVLEIQYAHLFDPWLEVLNYGPLSLAAVRKSKEDMARVLLHSRSCIEERNFRGQSPLHLSCRWPYGTDLLLRAGGHILVNQVDVYGNIPLVYACKARCLETMELLLEAGSKIDSSTLNAVVENFPDDIPKSILVGLKSRRNCLYNLALATLPEHTLNSMKLRADRILDADLFKVGEALHKNGIEIPDSLCCWPATSTVYHTSGLTAKQAELYFNAGFLDIDEPDMFNETYLVFVCKIYDWEETGLDLIQWAISRGVDTSRRVGVSTNDKSAVGNKETSKTTALHCIGGFLGRFLWEKNAFNVIYKVQPGFTISRERPPQFLDKYGSKLLPLIEMVLTGTLTDGCRCACSIGGCFPITLLLRAFQLWHGSELVCHLAFEWMRVVLAEKYPAQTLLAFTERVIRFQTFERLDITHTCDLHFNIIDGLKVQNSEIDEVHDEERILIQRLEALVKEFMQKFEELGEPLYLFLGGYWSDRMEEEMKEDKCLAEKERADLRELGIVLGPEPAAGNRDIVSSDQYKCLIEDCFCRNGLKEVA